VQDPDLRHAGSQCPSTYCNAILASCIGIHIPESSEPPMKSYASRKLTFPSVKPEISLVLFTTHAAVPLVHQQLEYLLCEVLFVFV